MGIHRMREAGLTSSRRQLTRRLETWDRESSGRLLRWVGQAKAGGTREVNTAILRQFLRADPVQRERELSEIHERIDILDGRTKAIRSKLVSHEKQLAENRVEMERHAKQISLLHAFDMTLVG